MFRVQTLVQMMCLHVVVQNEIGGVLPTRDIKKRYKVETSFLLSFGTLMQTKTSAQSSTVATLDCSPQVTFE